MTSSWSETTRKSKSWAPARKLIGAFSKSASGSKTRASESKASASKRKPLADKALNAQADRIAHCARSLTGPGLLVLNDPVGSGKTGVSLCTAALLLGAEGHQPTGGRSKNVTKVVIVAPSHDVARDIWMKSAAWAGLQDVASIDMPEASRAPVVIAAVSQLGEKGCNAGIPRDKSRLLLIVDEAHRGLHTDGTTYLKISKLAKGARTLLVTATPFQLNPSGLENMLEVDGVTDRGDRIAAYSRAVARWLIAQVPHEDDIDSAARKREIQVAEERMLTTFKSAKKDLQTILMPAYDRKAMGMPKELALPNKTSVPLGDWANAYHVARVLPEIFTTRSETAKRDKIVNSDAYIRMLTSSNRAWRHSAVVKAISEQVRQHGTGATLLTTLEEQIGSKEEPLRHPKVAKTTELALEIATGADPRHVLIFCVFIETQADLYEAIEQSISDNPDVRVMSPRSHSEARAMVMAEAGFGTPVSDTGRPIIMVVRDNLSESIDMDGGEPAVIHHDLSWSPVRWTQRMGRVVRASTGFRGPDLEHIFVPVLEANGDERMWQTLQNRRELSERTVPAELQKLFGATQPDDDTLG